MKKIAIFASGSGTNFEVLAKKILNKEIKAELVLLFSDKRDAYALTRAENLGIAHLSFSLKEFENKLAYEQELLKIMRKKQIDLIVLAGYMRIVGKTLLEAFPNKIINIHPAYLPEFPGAHAINDAWEAGVFQSGVTVHYIDEGIDTGAIIEQIRVRIDRENDTIESFEERIHQAEYELYPKVIQKLVE